MPECDGELLPRDQTRSPCFQYVDAKTKLRDATCAVLLTVVILPEPGNFLNDINHQLACMHVSLAGHAHAQQARSFAIHS